MVHDVADHRILLVGRLSPRPMKRLPWVVLLVS